MTTAAASWNALILAGSRSGPPDPVARHSGVELKCLAPVLGIPMLARVVGALDTTGQFERIAVSLAEPSLLDQIEALAACRRTGRLIALPAAASPSLSVRVALDTLALPLLVTTADHPLLSPTMITSFGQRAALSGADIAVGVASEAIIHAAYPQSVRTFLRFRDGGYSGCNLFALLTEDAAHAVAFWRRVEQDRKRPWRIARAFGPRLLLSYLFRRLSLGEAIERASQAMGAKAAAIALDEPEAAIDVDKPADLALVEQILAAPPAP